jgi:hypothetical protein
MARVALTVNALTANAGLTDPTGTASVAGAGNGFSIAANSTSLTNVYLRCANASGGTGTVSVLAGSQPSAQSSGQGPVTVSIATATTFWVGPFDSSRLQQPDGTTLIETSVVMTITAFSVEGRRV